MQMSTFSTVEAEKETYIIRHKPIITRIGNNGFVY